MSNKNKRGRPLSSPLVRDKSVAVRLNKKELQALSFYSLRYHASVSDVIRDALAVLSVIPENPVATS